MGLRPASLLCAVLVAPVAGSAAALSATAQTRNVEWSSEGEYGQYQCWPPPTGCSPISSTPTSDGNSASASDFLPFSASLDDIVDQASSIAPKLVLAVGSHQASGSASFTPTGTPGVYDASYEEVASRSLFSLDFDVAETTPYSLDAEIAATSLLAASLARVRLTGPGGATLASIELSGDGSCLDPSCEDLGSEALHQSGVLAPGSYTLLAEVDGETYTIISPGTGTAAAGTHTGSYDATLVLDPPAVPGLGGAAPALALLLGATGAALTARRRPPGIP